MTGKKEQLAHRSVLLDEAVQALALEGERAHGRYVDATFGRGGHSAAILQRLSDSGRLIALDKDPEGVACGRAVQDKRFEIAQASFAELSRVLAERGIAQVDGVLMDLGVSSPQVDDPARGFSFRFDGPLDMRMDPTQGISAAQWLADASESEIREVIHDYGEERFAGAIAKAIVACREGEAITGTAQLARIVAGAVKTREKGKDPATRSFQAIRIFINRELEDLDRGLGHAFDALAPQGRLVVISFHSLEDRRVKHFLADKAGAGARPDRRLPLLARDLPRPQMKVLRKVKPTEAEIRENPRARSALMRVGLRLDTTGRP